MRGRLFLLNQSQVIARQPFPLEAGVCSVGRSSHCDLVVPDVTISRRHAEIRVECGSVTIVDLNSRNGTFVNNARIASCPLREGESVRFGRIRFLLASSADALECLDSAQETADQREALHVPIPEWISSTLSPAQLAVLLPLIQGLTQQEIADRLDLSPHTVHNHVRDVYRTLGVHSRVELLALVLGRR